MRQTVAFLLAMLCWLMASPQQRLYTDKEKGGSEGGVVGTLEGEFQINQIGQATYEIPIPAAPGTGGMTPKLSIVYNSSCREGMFGYGFDLAGLPIIHRSPSDAMIDGKTEPVNFTTSDKYSLDGSRLVKVRTLSDGSIEYRTEHDSYSRITSKGGEPFPTSFTMQTQSGLTYSFSPVTRLIGAYHNLSLFWLVTKVADTNGNYFTVSYEGDPETNDYRVTRIDYTGNTAAGLEPYASLRFSYRDNPSASITYVGGQKVRRSKIISEIDCFCSHTHVRRLKINHQVVNAKYQIGSISEQEADGTAKNSTVFSWSYVPDYDLTKTEYNETPLITKANVVTGDFNGDGTTDFMVYPQNKDAGWTGWHLFLCSDGQPGHADSGQWNWAHEVEQVVSGDFNGDGLTDIVVKRRVNDKWHNCDLYTTGTNGDKVSFEYVKTFFSVAEDYAVHPVEINGDGADDILITHANSTKCSIIRSEVMYGSLDPLSYTAERNARVKWERVEFGDFNGDGLTDVMNMTSTGYDILQSDGAGTLTDIGHTSWPTTAYYVELADLNGDGKTDMLVTGKEGDNFDPTWKEWATLYATGDGTFEKTTNTARFNAKDISLVMLDINADGLDDFIAIDRKTDPNTMSEPTVYRNEGTGTFYKVGTGDRSYSLEKWRYYLGDFNGDGKTDILCTSNWNTSNWDGYQLFLMNVGRENLLSGIRDGLGNKTEIGYGYLSDPAVCAKGGRKTFPLSTRLTPWPVVTTVTVPDGIGGPDTTTYSYGAPIFHKGGRGFLCFESMSVSHPSTGVKSESIFEVNTERFVAALKASRSYINGRLVSECTNTNALQHSFPNDASVHVYNYRPVKTEERSYEYNTGEKVSDTSVSYTYDAYGNITESVAKSGNVTARTVSSYTNDETAWRIGRLTESTVTKTKPGSVSTRKASFSYDPVTGLLSSETVGPDDPATGYTKSYERDVYGNITASTTSPLDGTAPRTIRSTYTSDGRFVESTTDALGFTATNVVDPLTGLVSSTTDENGITTSHTYEYFGVVNSSAGPVTKTVATTGWSEGMADAPATAVWFIYSRTTGGPLGIEFYDCLGRKVRTVSGAAFGKTVYSDIVYDSNGRVTKSSEPYFKGTTPYWNSFAYDEAGRCVAQTDAAGNTTSVSFEGLSTVTTDANGNRTVRKNDLNGNLVSVTDALGGKVAYSYDASGHCIEIKAPRKTIRMEYDRSGNRTLLDDPDCGVTEETYNGFGELVSKTDPFGTVTYKYDGGGRLVQEKGPDYDMMTVYDGGWKGAVDESFMLVDGKYYGRTYEYDSYGRLVRECLMVDRTNFITHLTYNSLGQLETIKYPTELKILQKYDSSGVLSSITDFSSGKAYWTLEEMTPRGQVYKEVYGNGQQLNTIHDSQLGYVTATGTQTSGLWMYEYDAVGNLKARCNRSRGLTERFGYDALNRVVSVDVNGAAAQTVEYDAAGNITYMTGVGTFEYEEGSNRLLRVADYESTPLAWNGISYTSFRKVASMSGNGATMTFHYGADKKKVCQTKGTQTRYYFGKLFEEETDIATRTVTNYSYIYAHGRMVAMVIDSPDTDGLTEVYMHHDHLGSVVAYTDADGKLLQELSYDAWGRRRNPATWEVYARETEADAWKERGFCGHEHIAEFEIVDMGGRMYDPWSGRFISPDPFVQMPENTQSFNRFSYCVNNPLSLVDPTGYSWLSRNWRSLVGSIVGIAVSVATLGSGSGIGAAIIAGVVGGAAGAMTGAILNGCNFAEVAKSTLKGALFGGMGGFFNFAAGDGSLLESLFKHTFSQGWMEGIQGGNLFHGMLMGAVSKVGGMASDYGSAHTGMIGGVIASSVVSGTVDEIGGGKFANGAITGAFSYLFNETQHKRYIWDKNLKNLYDLYYAMAYKYENDAAGFYKSLGGPLAIWAATHPEYFGNTCAAKLSYALNHAGYKIPKSTKGAYEGAHGFYYIVRASDMMEYLQNTFHQSDHRVYNIKNVHNSVIYQPIGTGGVSGHVDVIYRDKSASRSMLPYDTYITGK